MNEYRPSDTATIFGRETTIRAHAGRHKYVPKRFGESNIVERRGVRVSHASRRAVESEKLKKGQSTGLLGYVNKQTDSLNRRRSRVGN